MAARWLLLKRFLLAFWALYLTLVTTTNVLDGLKDVGLLSASGLGCDGAMLRVLHPPDHFGAGPPAQAGPADQE
jgi:hypothetical protein